MKHFLLPFALLVCVLPVHGQMLSSHAPTPLAESRGTVEGQSLDRPVVKVNGTALTNRDLLREMYAIFPYAQQHGGGFPKDLEPQIRDGALKMIIFEELVYQEAQRRKVTIAPERINTAVAKFKKRFPASEYSAYLQVECKGSEKVLRERIRRSLLIEALLKQEVDAKSVVSLAEAKAYYDKNPQSFQHGEVFWLQTISIMPPANSAPEVLKEAHARAEEAVKKAKETKNYKEFGLLAEKMSDDDWHVNMGDRKEVPAEKLPPPVVEAARKMKVGQVSDLLQFGTNYTLFRLDGHTPAGKTSFDFVKKQLKTDLQKAKNNRLRTELNQRLQKTAKVQVL